MEEPDLGLKLDGEQRARGWGLFLIRNMVDAMQVRTDGPRHTIQLTMRGGGATPVPHSGELEGGGHEGRTVRQPCTRSAARPSSN